MINSTIFNIIECIALSSGPLMEGRLYFLPVWLQDFTYIPISIQVLIASTLVGCAGILPLWFIPQSINQADNLLQGDGAKNIKLLLAFAVGGILGDVFLHSLPEIWNSSLTKNGGDTISASPGLWILLGLITFIAAEKILTMLQKMGENLGETGEKKVSGYLNLVANTIDNCTHGLSVGGAFLASPYMGWFTTFAILMHEIPHEVGDFAILLNAGFKRREAAIWQLSTASGGLVGAFLANNCAADSLDARTSWILPFTTGSFLYLALVTILPTLMSEEDSKESLKQIGALIAGIAVMAIVASIF